MRFLSSVSALSLLASTAMAGTFTLDSEVSAVTVYPRGATIIRSMEFDIPAGRHTLTIADIPYQFSEETMRVLGETGLDIGAIQVKRSRSMPDGVHMEARALLESEIESLEAQIRATQENAAAKGLIINAASARIKLLDSIGGQQAAGAATALEAEAISVETLTALVSLVGAETLSALQDAQTARVEIAEINRQAEELRIRLKQALEELAQLSAPSDWRHIVSFDVGAAEATSGTLQISYVFGGEVGWRPVYDFELDTETSTLTIDRKVSIGQSTGETWDQAQITVSTAFPFSFEEFSLPYTNLARHMPPPPPPAPMLMRSADAGAVFAAPEVVDIEEPSAMGGPSFVMQGITATYILPEGTIIAGSTEGYEPSLISIGTEVFDVEMTARANMGNDSSTAFVVAEFTNDSGAPFLPGPATYFRDGSFVRNSDNSGEIGLIAAGDTATLDFGQINGLLVTRNTLRREDGSSGVITTSNDRIVEYEFEVENVSSRAWDVVVYDRVPVSEQEDLLIDWTARPRPTNTDIEGRRGVLAWQFTLESGARKAIKLSYELEWPEGNELRVAR